MALYQNIAKFLFPFAVFVQASSVAAASGPVCGHWLGKWKLDRGASKLTGEVIDVKKTPSGYRFDFGAIQFTIPDDGQFYPTVAGRETMLSKTGALRWIRAHRINGRIVDRSTLTVSSDQQTLTISKDGKGASTSERLVRIDQGEGLAGLWRSNQRGINASEVMVFADTGDGRIQWGAPAEGNYYRVKIGGPTAVNEGPTSVRNATLRAECNGPNELRWTENIDDKPYRVGIYRLSDDEMILTETTWPTHRHNDRETIIYRRQNKN